MRINRFLALGTGMSRRAADQAIADGRVLVDGQIAEPGTLVEEKDVVLLDGQAVETPPESATIIFNKPVGYVVSRDGQGSPTVYDLLPAEYQALKPIGRLDKDSSGLLLLTNDGKLANELTHPRYAKTKIYEVTLNKHLEPLHQQMINDHGIELDDGNSRLRLDKLDESAKQWRITMTEGRNRQIRRTFAALGYEVLKLNRTTFGNYQLGNLKSGSYR
jgi:23S rRNA pseudouridine2605 synthase